MAPSSPAQRKRQKRQQKRREDHNTRVEDDQSESSGGEKNTELSSTGDRAKGYAKRAKEATARRTQQAKNKASSLWNSFTSKVSEGVAGARQATQGRSPSADLNRTSEKVAKGTAEVSSLTLGAVQRATTTSLGALKGFAEGIVSSTGQARLAAQKFDIETATEVAEWDGHIDTGDGEVPDDTCLLFPKEGGDPQRIGLNHATETGLRLGADRHRCFVVPLIDEESKALTGAYVLVKGGGPVYYQPINSEG